MYKLCTFTHGNNWYQRLGIICLKLKYIYHKSLRLGTTEIK